MWCSKGHEGVAQLPCSSADLRGHAERREPLGVMMEGWKRGVTSGEAGAVANDSRYCSTADGAEACNDPSSV